MAVTRLEIRARQPFAEGRAFGQVGPYERVEGTLHFAVDPANPANRAITDLDRAERDAAGRVAFESDFCLLQPLEPARGNRGLLLEVLNRGRKLLNRQLNHAPEDTPVDLLHPGDGFLLRHGWTIAWCGWQWDVVPAPGLMGLRAPQALEGGRPIRGRLIVQFQPTAPQADKLLANRVHQPYPAADLEDPEATLTVQDWAEGPRTLIPRERWRFARDEAGRPVPDDTHAWLEGGFEPGRYYEVVYRTRICPVVGTGLLAIRDCAAFLRHAEAAAGNPCAGRLDRAIGFGISQSGRFLRHFLQLGLNLDEAGRRVFDGLLPHVAGERRGEFNQRFGQPSVQYTPGFGHLAPFAEDEQTDPVSGRRDGLLRRQRELGGVPLLVQTNSSAEYWRGGASLIHTDLAGERDVEPPTGARTYLFAGSQHGPGSLPVGNVNPGDGSHGAHPFNALDYVPLLRAALTNLDRWIAEGVEPPPSVFPRLADGTAARGAEVLETLRGLPGLELPDPELLPRLRRFELGPDAVRGIGRFPAGAGEPYRVYVSAVDADGNEVGGLRMPDLAVPVATYTPWNPRHADSGGRGQIIPMQGSTLPFAATAAERRRRGDRRPSLEERYAGREDYLARVRAAAETLVARRYLLAEDVELAVELAAERYDAYRAGPGWAVLT